MFTSGGLRLRSTQQLSSTVLATMPLGAEVEIVEVFGQEENQETIEGFDGHWVKVKYKDMVGFAFDGFLSALPFPKMEQLKDSLHTFEEVINPDAPYYGQNIERIFEAYIHLEFLPVCEPVEYFNGNYGGGTDYVTLNRLNNGFTHGQHGYYEGWGTELIMPGTRLSELKNLVLLLSQGSGVDRSTISDIQTELKRVTGRESQITEILRLDMLFIYIKIHYSGDNPYWSLIISCASA
ncbi:MAG: SH3 domain-containing protein [Saprospiraceae bacterium]